MPKTSIDRLGGRSMGTGWSVQIEAGGDLAGLQRAFQDAVDAVDRQMSTWNAASDLMRLNGAPCGEWIDLPAHLAAVLRAGLDIGAATGGAFEMNVGTAVQAWGFGAVDMDLAAIRAASAAPRISAQGALELDGLRARKTAPLALDLSGIAKGYGVDLLAQICQSRGIPRALSEIDGEMRAIGRWPVAIEDPDTGGAHSVIELTDGAAATSGDYRHFVTIKGARLPHTIDPARGSPLVGGPASVTVLGQTCMAADAMATALTVMGAARGMEFARAQGISALFILRGPTRAVGTGAFAA